MPRQLRIEPANPIAPDGEVRGIEDGLFDEIQDSPINVRALRLHQVEHEFRGSVPAFMHDPYGRVIALRNGFDPDLAFEDRIGIIQNSVDRVRCIAIAC